MRGLDSMHNAIRLVVIAFLVAACGIATPTAPSTAIPIASAESLAPPTTPTSPAPSESTANAASPAPDAASISLELSQDPAFVGDQLRFEATSSPTGGPTSVLISAATINFGDGTSAIAVGSCTAALDLSHAYRNPGDFQPRVTEVTRCDPGAAADLSYADAMVHIFPAAPAASARWPVCSTFQLQLAGPWTGAGLGNVATLITLRNIGPGGCRLEGYPKVILVARGGHPLRTHDGNATTGDYMFPAVVPHRVAIGPGELASFMIGYGDNPFGPTANQPYDVACPPADAVRISLPGTIEFGTAHVAIGACGGVVRVSPIVPGANGLRFP